MSESEVAVKTTDFAVLPYHKSIVRFLKKFDPQVWAWFAKSASSVKAGEEIRFELLKSTYRIERESQLELYELAETVANQFGITAPITIYQAQNPIGLNASLAYVPNEIHLILHGAITKNLTPIELSALLGHELAHYLFFEMFNGEMRIASDMLHALANDVHAQPAHYASVRLFRLYTEIFCDRGSFAVTKDINSVISMLVKISTELEEVNAEGYLRQAEEVIKKGNIFTQQVTHPESFIRAWAIKLYGESNTNSDQIISELIEGQPELDELDFLEQEKISLHTRRVLDQLLCRKWFQTGGVLAHAKLYFEDYKPPESVLIDKELSNIVRTKPISLRDYYCYVLLDFAAADRDLDEAPIAATLTLAEQLEIKPQFIELLRKEMKLRKNQIDKIDRDKESILIAAEKEIVA